MNLDFTKITEFEWDKGNLEHIKKHKVIYEECEQIFRNIPLFITEDDTHSQIEKRFRVYGKTHQDRVLCLIYIIRKHKIRVISARDQNKKERLQFKKGGGLT